LRQSLREPRRRPCAARARRLRQSVRARRRQRARPGKTESCARTLRVHAPPRFRPLNHGVPVLKTLLTLMLSLAAGVALAAGPQVALETNQGRIVLELNADKAPRTVENFVGYVESGHYDGTIFHRVIDGFMIQGGGFTADMRQ